MKIKATENFDGCPDGFTSRSFAEDEEYDVPAEFGASVVEGGQGVEVVEVEEAPAPPAPSGTKSNKKTKTSKAAD